MHDAVHLARTRITAALGYLARARTALPATMLGDAALAIDGAEMALHQALKNLPDSVATVAERRRPRLLMENTVLERGRTLTPADESLPLDIQFPIDDEPGPAATSWRF